MMEKIHEGVKHLKRIGDLPREKDGFLERTKPGAGEKSLTSIIVTRHEVLSRQKV